MSKLLINEYPLQVLPTLATWIGLNEAIILQQIHYWLSNPKIGKQHENRKWVRNTVDQWRKENFPFWSANTIRRTIANLEEKGLVLSTSALNKAKYDKTKWYTIDYEILNSLEPTTQNGQWVSGDPLPKMGNATTQNGQSDLPKMGNAIPETTTETTNRDSSKEGEQPPLPEIPPKPKPPTKAKKPTPSGKKAKQPDRPPGVDVFRGVARRFPDKAVWPMIGETVKEDEKSLDFWADVIRAWIGCGWNKINVKGMLEFYQRGELPPGERRNGKNETNQNGHKLNKEPYYDVSTGQNVYPDGRREPA